MKPPPPGIARSPAYHYEPETNGCVERFIQTLKEQILWIERFDTLEQLRARIRQFARDFNDHWLLECAQRARRRGAFRRIDTRRHDDPARARRSAGRRPGGARPGPAGVP